MFGLIVSGRLVSTSWEQAGPTNVIAEIQVATVCWSGVVLTMQQFGFSRGSHTGNPYYGTIGIVDWDPLFTWGSSWVQTLCLAKGPHFIRGQCALGDPSNSILVNLRPSYLVCFVNCWVLVGPHEHSQDADSVNHVVIFLTGAVPFPEGTMILTWQCSCW